MTNTHSKLTLVINSFGGGGAERQFSILARALKFEKIICLENENVYLSDPPCDIVYLTNHHSKTSSLYKYFYCFIYAFKLYRHLKHEKNIKIISVLERSHISVWLLSFLMKIDYILSFQVSHKSHYNNLFGSILKIIFKQCIRRSKLCVPNSYAGALEFIELYKMDSTKVIAIPNGYDFDEIKGRALHTDSCPFPALLQQKYILCVARFFNQKAQDKLIEAFSVVKKKHQDVKLVFAGTGSKMQECIDLSLSESFRTFVSGKDEYSDEFDVYFLGFQSNPLILMKHATLFAFPSYYEGLPNALIEAMICGAVPVSSDCPTGPREIIAPESDLNSVADTIEVNPCGILVAPFESASAISKNDLQNWTDAVNWVLDQPEKTAEIKTNMLLRSEEYKINNIIEKWKFILTLQ